MGVATFEDGVMLDTVTFCRCACLLILSSYVTAGKKGSEGTKNKCDTFTSSIALGNSARKKKMSPIN